MMGGDVRGGRILGTHPNTYKTSDFITPRGVWVPRISNEAMWHGVSQWAGVTRPQALEFILPNSRR